MKRDYLIKFADGEELKVKNVHMDSKTTPGIVRFINENEKAKTKVVVSVHLIKFIEEIKEE